MVKKIAVYHGKGGVGKTTTTGNIACWLAEHGHSVLAVDADYSANLTSWLLENVPDKTLLDLFQGCPIKDVVCQSVEPNLKLLPSCFDLAAYEPILDQKMARETILRKALNSIQDEYDFILIDSKPGVSVISRNVLCAVDEVIIPVDATFAVNDLEQVFEVFMAVHESGLNPKLQIRGVLITKDNPTTKLSKNIREAIIDRYGKKYGVKIFETVISENVDLKYCLSEHKSIYQYEPASNGAISYGALSRELMAKWRMV